MLQGDKRWFKARAGRITGSRAGTIVNGGNRAWNTLLDTLAAEAKMTGEELFANQIDAAPLRWGKKYEPIATAQYELTRGVDLEHPAFITNSAYPGCGYSPDGLWPKMTGLTEVKCPYNTENHAATVMYGTGAENYKPQMQFGMMITEMPFCDFISFDKRYHDPANRLFVIRVLPDLEYKEKMVIKINRFLLMLETGARFGKKTDEIPDLF